MLGALLWGIGASMALAEENTKAKTKSIEEELEEAKEIIEELLTDNSDEKTRKKALDFLYPDKKGD